MLKLSRLHKRRLLDSDFFQNSTWFPRDAGSDSISTFYLTSCTSIIFKRDEIQTLREKKRWRPHLLPAAVGRDGSLRGSSQSRPVVVEVAGRIHLMLQRQTQDTFTINDSWNDDK